MHLSVLIFAAGCCLPLVACGNGPSGQSGSPGSSPTPAAASSDGSILISLRGETVDRDSAGNADSAQCQLQPSARNQGRLNLKSLMAEFEITKAGDGTVIQPDATLTMPMAIAAGESKDAWGPLLVDGHRCEDLAIKLLPTPVGGCRTATGAPCPAYRLEATGVARVL